MCTKMSAPTSTACERTGQHKKRRNKHRSVDGAASEGPKVHRFSNWYSRAVSRYMARMLPVAQAANQTSIEGSAKELRMSLRRRRRTTDEAGSSSSASLCCRGLVGAILPHHPAPKVDARLYHASRRTQQLLLHRTSRGRTWNRRKRKQLRLSHGDFAWSWPMT